MTAAPQSNIEVFTATFNHFVANAWPDETSKLHQAIRYCLAGDGKRVRALLAMMVCESYGQNSRQALAAATAVEMVHAYSLAHDDLPCMDNDDWRRGRPSLHKAFDEATALLAGDAILTDAMRVLVDRNFFEGLIDLSDHQRMLSVRELARAAGGHGMVYGQDLDMYWTGRETYTQETLEKIHAGKTGALLGASCAMGAVAAGATDPDIESWRQFGILVGLAFQAIDDTLDVTESTGKSQGKDVAQGKLTFLSLHSYDEVLRLASGYTASAITLVPEAAKADRIIEFVKELLSRRK